MPKFKIGDTIYRATYGQKRVTKPCPVCFGKMRVVLILGNDEEVSLACDYCGKGNFGVPTGVDHEYEYVTEAESFLIDGTEIAKDADGERVVYRHGCYSCPERDCYATREEAMAAAITIRDAEARNQRERTEYIKKDAKKSFAWNAGYHMREAKRNRQQAEYHEEKARLCKLRKKEPATSNK